MTEQITSLQNARVKEAVKLRDRKGREAQGRTIIDGAREISRALDGAIEVVELFHCESLLREEATAVLSRAAQQSVPLTAVTQLVFEKLAFGDRGDGLTAVAIPPRYGLDDLRPAGDAIVAVLERVEKPGNVGAVVRTADATGTSAVLVADAGTDLYNPNAIRASLGSVFSVPVVAATSTEILAWLREHHFEIFAARVGGATNYSDVAYTGRTAIALGSEAEGLTDAWQCDDVTPICLPMCGINDSLNVSVTAAVLLYEVLRQRTVGDAR